MYVNIRHCSSIVICEVNAWCRVVDVKQFDLARVAFCTGGVHPGYDRCLLAWLYRQETPTGFRLDCHVLRLSSRTRARRLAACIGASFSQAFADIQAAVEIGCRLALDDRTNSSSASSCWTDDDRRDGVNNELAVGKNSRQPVKNEELAPCNQETSREVITAALTPKGNGLASDDEGSVVSLDDEVFETCHEI